MQRRSVIALGLAAAGAAAFPQAGLAAARGWRTLFDGRNLDAFTQIGQANWTLKDGAVEADKGTGGFLVTKETFGNTDIRAEFWVSEDANSGVFIRCTNPFDVQTWSAYEVNIFEKRPDQAYATGGIVDVAKVASVPKTGGKWNVIDITARGELFSVAVNGVKTVDKVRNGLRAHGRIALQYGSGVVKFRKLQVRDLGIA